MYRHTYNFDDDLENYIGSYSRWRFLRLLRFGIDPPSLLCAKDLEMVTVLFILFLIFAILFNNQLLFLKKTYILVKAVSLAISGERNPERPILEKFLL